jgi:hypothetical protein
MGLLYLYMENVSVNGRIILKCILEKKVCDDVYYIFRLTTEISGRMIRTDFNS